MENHTNAADFLCHESLNKNSLKNPTAMEASEEDLLELSSPPTLLLRSNAESASLLGPITPDSNKEPADTISCLTTPLTTFPSPPRCLDSHPSSSTINTTPCTPKEGVFDPFAPGPDKLMLAPHCTKYLEESRSFVVRRLNFATSPLNIQGEANHASNDTTSDEDMLLESVYDSLLKAIILKQTEEILSEFSSMDPPSPDGFKTPTSAPLRRGIAEICPGAPLKPARKLRNIDLSLWEAEIGGLEPLKGGFCCAKQRLENGSPLAFNQLDKMVSLSDLVGSEVITSVAFHLLDIGEISPTRLATEVGIHIDEICTTACLHCARYSTNTVVCRVLKNRWHAQDS